MNTTIINNISINIINISINMYTNSPFFITDIQHTGDNLHNNVSEVSCSTKTQHQRPSPPMLAVYIQY